MTTEAILEILGIVFGAGMFYAKLEGISRDVRRLESKVEKHNSFDRRIVRLESIIDERVKLDEEIRATNSNLAHYR